VAKTYLLVVVGVGTEEVEYEFDQLPKIIGDPATSATTEYEGIYTDDGVAMHRQVLVRNKNIVSTYITEVSAEP
jgi:hypothetical protein